VSDEAWVRGRRRVGFEDAEFAEAYAAECVFPDTYGKEDRSRELKSAGSRFNVAEDETVCCFVGHGLGAHDDLGDVYLDGDTLWRGGVRICEGERAREIG